MQRETLSKVTVSISHRTIFLVLTIVALVWISLHLLTVMIVIFSAIVLATAIDPPVSWMQARGVPRPVGVLAISALLVLALVGLALLLIPLVNFEIQALQSNLPDYARQLENLLQRIAPRGSSQTTFNLSGLTQQLSSHLQTIVLELTQVSLLAGRIVLLVFVTLVTTYFMAINPAMGTGLLRRFAPGRYHSSATAMSRAIRIRIGGWARGQVLIAMTYGIAMGAGLWLLGVPYAFSLAAIAAALEVVPYLGGLVTLILAVPLALTVGPIQAIGVVVLYIVLVNIESHILAPIFFGRAVGLPPVAILLALLVGVESAGVVGALLAVPATVVVWAIVEQIWPDSEEVTATLDKSESSSVE